LIAPTSDTRDIIQNAKKSLRAYIQVRVLII
jgi:hypothetical protein